MNFSNRIKKEMTEGIVRAILEEAGYRVIDSGIESILRELSCMSNLDYSKLGYPHAMKNLPDFTVMDKDQTEKFLVEVKFRSKWGKDLFLEILDQIKLFKEVVLVSINANPHDPKFPEYPSTYIRCCRVKWENEKYQIELKYTEKGTKTWNHYWQAFDKLPSDESLWWGMSELDKVFKKLNEDKLDKEKTLKDAVSAISGILK